MMVGWGYLIIGKGRVGLPKCDYGGFTSMRGEVG